MQQDNNKNKMTRIFLNVYITSLLLFVDFIVENNVLFMNKTTKRHQQQWIILKVYLIAQFLEKKNDPSMQSTYPILVQQL